MRHRQYLYQHQTQKIKENLNTDKIYQKLEEKNSEIDENTKKANDRTWCFWDEDNLFDYDIILKD